MKRKKLIVALIFLLFVLPFGLSEWTMHKYGKVIPFALGTVNQGILINPTISLGSILNPNQPIPTLQNKWYLVVVTISAVSSVYDTLDKVKRIRLALGRDYTKTDVILAGPSNVWSSNTNVNVPTLQLSNEGAASLLRIVGQSTGIYLMDNQGNIALGYPITIDPQSVYQDLQRLLSVASS